MTDRQKKLLEDEINTIQDKINYAHYCMGVDNYWGNHDTAKLWSRSADEFSDQLKGIKIALAVFGYRIGWKDNKAFITDEY